MIENLIFTVSQSRDGIQLAISNGDISCSTVVDNSHTGFVQGLNLLADMYRQKADEDAESKRKALIESARLKLSSDEQRAVGI